MVCCIGRMLTLFYIFEIKIITEILNNYENIESNLMKRKVCIQQS